MDDDIKEIPVRVKKESMKERKALMRGRKGQKDEVEKTVEQSDASSSSKSTDPKTNEETLESDRSRSKKGPWRWVVGIVGVVVYLIVLKLMARMQS